MIIDHINDRTSPRSLHFINYKLPAESLSCPFKDGHFDISPFYVSCIYCKNLKMIKRNYNEKKLYKCKECRKEITNEYINTSKIRGG